MARVVIEDCHLDTGEGRQAPSIGFEVSPPPLDGPLPFDATGMSLTLSSSLRS